MIDKCREEKRILNITNNLIAQYKALPPNEKFAENKDYQLGERDHLFDESSLENDTNQILKAIEESYGKSIWKEKTEVGQKEIIEQVSKEYQAFFSDKERKFKKLPHLQLLMKRFLSR